MKTKSFLIICTLFLGTVAVWRLAAQTTPVTAEKGRWLRVIEAEMDLVPRMTRTFQPRAYQIVDVIVGAGEFGQGTPQTFSKRMAPRGATPGFRIDTSDPDFMIVVLGYNDNLGRWQDRVVHYIPWNKIVDLCFETSNIVSSGVPH